MDGSTAVAKDRPFDPSRVPRTDNAAELVRLALDHVRRCETRKRKRRLDDQRRHDQALGALVCDLAHRHLGIADAWITVPMAKKKLAKAKRRAEFLTEKFADLVTTLASPTVGLAEFRRGYRTDFGGVESTLRVSGWLRDAVASLGLSQWDFRTTAKHSADPIVLRGRKHLKKAPNLDVPDTEEVRRLREEMIAINAWLESADIDYAGEGRIDIYSRRLRRIFNDARFDAGGRLIGGFWQNMPSAERLQHLVIADQGVVSVDFAQLGVTIAYGRARAPMPPGDLYTVGGMDRHGVKKVLNALLSVDRRLTRFPSGTKAHFKGWTFPQVLNSISEHHAPIVHLFGTALALHIQNVESNVIVRVLLRLKDSGVVGLPVHDCVLVRDDKADIVKAIMERTFLEVAGVGIEAKVSTG